ncbi:hypothetical protein HYT84_00750 [Candidatus Micrarchaeota archaeon]|nr:hypothetical protein [Candidatus Micrarchaeota archaeon]
MRKRMNTFQPLPKALSCGIIEDNGRILFRVFQDEHGINRVETPCVLVLSGESITAKLKAKLSEILENNVEIGEPIAEFFYNAGSRKKKNLIPCVVFKIQTFGRIEVRKKSEFRWLRIEETKDMRKTKESEWLNRFMRK